jgi:DNA-binding CsgD family transcriptional regulator
MDEAMAAIGAGEISDLGIMGRCVCIMLAACQRVNDLRRAEQWTAVLAELFAAHGGPPRILQTQCRVAYGSLLKSTGRWDAAEAALLEAVSPGASRSFLLRVGAVAELADLRVLQGRLGEAAALLRPYEDRTEAVGPLARLHLARGEAALAAAKIDRALRHVVADRLREAALLGQLVEVELERANLAGAALAAERLAAVAAEVEGTTLRAEASLAMGRVAAAADDRGTAISHLEEGLRLLCGGGPPFLTGVILFVLAGVLPSSEALVEARSALAIFDRLGARAYADRTKALLRRLGDSERTRAASSPVAVGSLSGREADVLELVRQGLTNAQIGQRLFISPKTAEHHVSAVLGKLGVRSRAAAAALAVAASGK